MSSNISIVKICEFCKKEFIAKTTITKTCSDPCAKRLYKLKQRNSKIAQAELQTEIKRKPQAYITSEEIEVINAKQFLNLKEAAEIVGYNGTVSSFSRTSAKRPAWSVLDTTRIQEIFGLMVRIGRKALLSAWKRYNDLS